jgi:hypothetical protein
MKPELNYTQHLIEKWKPLLENEKLPKIKDPHRAAVTAILLENTQQDLAENKVHVPNQMMLTEAPIPVNFMGASSSDPSTGSIDTFDPILISMVRRAAPVLVAYDLVGVQPMTGPTGLIFAMRSRYTNQTSTETFYNEVNTMFSSVLSGANTLGLKHVGSGPFGNSTSIANQAATGLYNYGGAMSTAQAEALGTDSNSDFAQMAFSIEKNTVTAKSRALAAEYTLELAQDLKAVHGMDARGELINILSTEILAEINREVVRTVNLAAQIGAQDNVTQAGFFDLDTDSNGRWSVEKWKGLMFQMDREANALAKSTRRGKGNIAIMTSDVASALQSAGVLDYAPALNTNDSLIPDDTGSSFVGVLNGRIKVFIDPYASGGQYCTMGYRGPSPFDAGIFYCPYVPLQILNSVHPLSFVPRVGFKTRYGMTANPFAQGTTAGGGTIVVDSNVYYRKFLIQNLM